MKRLVKFSNPEWFKEVKFSDCSTNYTILDGLYEDNAGLNELIEAAKALNIEPLDKAYKAEESRRRRNDILLTHYVQIEEYLLNSFNGPEIIAEYLGFLTIPDIKGITPTKNIGNEISSDLMHDILNNQGNVGIYDIVTIHDENYMIYESWSGHHILPLLGYDLAEFIKRNSLETTFDDEVSMCGECCKWDWVDDGYTYNHRFINHDLVGINCGCYDELVKENIEDFVNNSEVCLEKTLANDLENKGVIEHVETFISGMVDGRGGYINGRSVREGQPKEILEQILLEDNDRYVFVREESGQFQTYFSLYKVNN